MILTALKTAARRLVRHGPWTDPGPDDEHENDEPDLTQGVQSVETGGREHGLGPTRHEPAETGRSNQEARYHFRDDGGLSHGQQQPSHRARERENDGDLEQQDQRFGTPSRIIERSGWRQVTRNAIMRAPNHKGAQVRMSAARQLETAVSYLRTRRGTCSRPSIDAIPERILSARMGARAVAEKLGANVAGTRLAANDRLVVPDLRPRDARAHPVRRRSTRTILVNEHVGEIKAHILERDGKVIIEKTCPQHGTFTDVLAINPEFLKRIEGLFPGRDYTAVTDRLHNHGTSSIKYGRGSVLTVDLTNRCNMMCDPCFMDANQVGYVHELTFDDVKKILDDALTIKPRRQLTVQFSGGEPTISPFFLDAVAYARQIGYFSAQAATNGIRFAQDPEYAMAAAKAGLRIAYLQFDGVGEEANAHRKVGNLFDVKLRAIENLYRAGIDIALVVTIVRTINDDQVGRIVKFAVENCDKISFVSFQPVSFTGRDEDIDDRTRAERRYTLSHLAEDIKSADRRHRAPARLVSAVGGWRRVGRDGSRCRARAPTGAR